MVVVRTLEVFTSGFRMTDNSPHRYELAPHLEAALVPHAHESL